MSLTVSASNVASEYSIKGATNKTKSTTTVFNNSSQAKEAPAKEANGKKSESWRSSFRQKMKGDYQITEKYVYSYSLGKKVKVYDITAKKDINLAGLKKELGIKAGIISNCNDGYGQYDYNGHYIENKPMKGVTFHIPVESLGEEIDDRGIWDKIKDFFF